MQNPKAGLLWFRGTVFIDKIEFSWAVWQARVKAVETSNLWVKKSTMSWNTLWITHTYKQILKTLWVKLIGAGHPTKPGGIFIFILEFLNKWNSKRRKPLFWFADVSRCAFFRAWLFLNDNIKSVVSLFFFFQGAVSCFVINGLFF